MNDNVRRGYQLWHTRKESHTPLEVLSREQVTLDWFKERLPAWLTEHGPRQLQSMTFYLDNGECFTLVKRPPQ